MLLKSSQSLSNTSFMSTVPSTSFRHALLWYSNRSAAVSAHGIHARRFLTVSGLSSSRKNQFFAAYCRRFPLSSDGLYTNMIGSAAACAGSSAGHTGHNVLIRHIDIQSHSPWFSPSFFSAASSASAWGIVRGKPSRT